MGIAATTLVVHLSFFTFVDPPQRSTVATARVERGEAGESFDGVGGTFVVSTDCMSDVLAGMVGRALACYLPPFGDRRACVTDALAWYRVEAVGCSAPDATEVAEYDAVGLVDPDTLEVAMLDPDLLEMFEQAKQRAIDKNLHGQVVDTPAPAVERRPDDYDYLAEHDNTVDKQMVKRGTPGGSVLPQPPRPQPELDPNAAAEQQSPSLATPGGGALSMRTPGAPGHPESDDQPSPANALGFDATSLDGIGALRAVTAEPVDRGPVGAGGQNGTGAGDGRPMAGVAPHNLQVTDDVMRRATGGTNDHLPGVEEGEYTALNTRKWKYATFFNRVKRQVAQNWHPERAYRLRDPTGNIYGTKDRLTVLTVSLEPDGTLHRVIISDPSGVEFLDDEAIKAFELAEPFPNPPGALIDGDSRLITFRFGFSFEISKGTPWRIFRYR